MSTENRGTGSGGPDNVSLGSAGPENAGPESVGPGSDVVNATVSDLPLHAGHANAAAWSPRCGAVVGFSGIVRDHDGGRSVATLSYTAHPTAEQIIAEVAAEIAGRYQGVRIWVGHRTGPLEIGDAALVAAVAAAHRGTAFAACSDLVDTVKARVPIWKEQGFADGTTEWVGVSDAPQ